MMSTTTKTELHRTLADRIEAACPGVVEVKEILDVTRAPSTKQHMGFNVTISETDSGKMRGRPGTVIRVDALVRVRIAYRLGKAERFSQFLAYEHEEAVTGMFLSRTNQPLLWVRPVYKGSSQVLHTSAEWVFNDLLYGFEYNRRLPDAAP